MKILIISLLFSLNAQAGISSYSRKADHLATADFDPKTFRQTEYDWPFPIKSIAHLMHSYQDYTGEPYWHDGLDIRGDANQPILISAGGKVVNIENYRPGNPNYWEVAILDKDGYVWKYHHVDPKTIPQQIKQAYKDGAILPAKAFIGNIIPWSFSSNGERFHHLHLLIVDGEGKYINPLVFMKPLADTRPPKINSIGISIDHRPYPGKTSVKGPHGLYVDASDLMLHHFFLLPPHKVSYAIDGGGPKVVWEFTHLPGKDSDLLFIEDFYLPGSCGDYRCRKFLMNLLFTLENPRGETEFPKGKHTVKVSVEDFFGNQASASWDWSSL